MPAFLPDIVTAKAPTAGPLDTPEELRLGESNVKLALKLTVWFSISRKIWKFPREFFLVWHEIAVSAVQTVSRQRVPPTVIFLCSGNPINAGFVLMGP